MTLHETPHSFEEKPQASRDSDLGELSRALLGAGAAWARYGLTVARSSLIASARSLEATAGVIDLLSDRVQQAADESTHPKRDG